MLSLAAGHLAQEELLKLLRCTARITSQIAECIKLVRLDTQSIVELSVQRCTVWTPGVTSKLHACLSK